MSTNRTQDFSNFRLNPIALTNVSGVCPAPTVLTIQGKPLTIDNTPICKFFDWVRPAVIAVGWFAAIGIFVSGVRR